DHCPVALHDGRKGVLVARGRKTLHQLGVGQVCRRPRGCYAAKVLQQQTKTWPGHAGLSPSGFSCACFLNNARRCNAMSTFFRKIAWPFAREQREERREWPVQRLAARKLCLPQHAIQDPAATDMRPRLATMSKDFGIAATSLFEFIGQHR